MSQISYGALVNAVKNLEREIYKGRNKYPLPTENSIRIDMLVSEVANLLSSLGAKRFKEVDQALNGKSNPPDNIAIFNENGISTIQKDPEDPQKKFDSIIKGLEYAIELLGASEQTDTNPAIINVDPEDENKGQYYDVIHSLQQIYDDVKNIKVIIDITINEDFNIFDDYP